MFFKAKNSCVLTPYVDMLSTKFGEFSPLYPCDAEVSTVLREYEKLSETLERKIVPETAKEFRNSLHYCLPSQLRKYQGIMPGAGPVAGLGLKGEKVYLRKHVSELHTG